MSDLNRAEFEERLRQELAQEAEQPTGWWYLSFATEAEFLGGAVICARGFLSAIMMANEMGINPGGEVRAWPIPGGSGMDIKLMSYSGKLLTKEELEEAGIARD